MKIKRKEVEFFVVLDKLYARIEAAGIGIPYDEVCEHFIGKRLFMIMEVVKLLITLQ